MVNARVREFEYKTLSNILYFDEKLFKMQRMVHSFVVLYLPDQPSHDQ